MVFFFFCPFTVNPISNKNFCSLISKDETQIKTKYNVSFSKPCLNSDETNVTCDETTPLSAIDKQSHNTEKVDPPSFTGKQILIGQRIDNYAIPNLPNEIIEIILVDAVKSSKNSIETYVIFLQTCSRFKMVY